MIPCSLLIFLLFSLRIQCEEITDSFSFPGGKLIRIDGTWEERKGEQKRILTEGGRDKDWILLIDFNQKLFYNLPTNGGQSYWTTESEKTKWKPWKIVKKEFTSQDKSLLTLCLNVDETKLLRNITQYRISKNLKPMSLSSSLTILAKLHLKDLEENPPTPGCNYHSWSNKGTWIPCCHTNNLVSMECSFRKAKELTDYNENAFEILYFEPEEKAPIPERALKNWMQNPDFNDFLTNKNEWKSLDWKAVGLAVSKRFAIVWLGTEKDLKDMPGLCN